MKKRFYLLYTTFEVCWIRTKPLNQVSIFLWINYFRDRYTFYFGLRKPPKLTLHTAPSSTCQHRSGCHTARGQWAGSAAGTTAAARLGRPRWWRPGAPACAGSLRRSWGSPCGCRTCGLLEAPRSDLQRLWGVKVLVLFIEH